MIAAALNQNKMRKIILLAVIAIAGLSAKAQTNASGHDVDWDYLTISKDENSTYYIYNKPPDTDFYGYKTQWVMAKDKVYTFGGKKYYGTTCMLQYKVDCESKRIRLMYCAVSNSSGSILWSDSIDENFYPAIPNSIGARILEAICY